MDGSHREGDEPLLLATYGPGNCVGDGLMTIYKENIHTESRPKLILRGRGNVQVLKLDYDSMQVKH